MGLETQQLHLFPCAALISTCVCARPPLEITLVYGLAAEPIGRDTKFSAGTTPVRLVEEVLLTSTYCHHAECLPCRSPPLPPLDTS